MKHPLINPGPLQKTLRYLRRRCGLTQAQLGYFLRVDRRRISQIECDPGKVSLNQLAALLSVLGGQLLIEYETAPDDLTVAGESGAQRYARLARPGRPGPGFFPGKN
jgi:HTH-type transcriptional regulator/antitoxin HipB